MQPNPYFPGERSFEPPVDETALLDELDLYQKGLKLRRFIQDPDWEIVVQILRDYKDNAESDLTDLPPGAANVPLSHAAASATKQIFRNFQQDIANAVQAATQPSEQLQAYLRGALGTLRAMGKGE